MPGSYPNQHGSAAFQAAAASANTPMENSLRPQAKRFHVLKKKVAKMYKVTTAPMAPTAVADLGLRLASLTGRLVAVEQAHDTLSAKVELASCWLAGLFPT